MNHSYDFFEGKENLTSEDIEDFEAHVAIIREKRLKVCDLCLRSEAEISPIRLTGDADGLMVCIDCETKYNQTLEPTCEGR